MDLSKLWPEEAKRLVLAKYKEQKVEEFRALEQEYEAFLSQKDDMVLNYQGAMDFLLSVVFKSWVSQRLKAWEEMGIDPSQNLEAQIIALYGQEVKTQAQKEAKLKKPSEAQRQQAKKEVRQRKTERENYLSTGKPRPNIQRRSNENLGEAERKARQNSKKGRSAVKAFRRRQAQEARRRRREAPYVDRVEAIQRRLAQIDKNSKEAQRLRSELGQLKKPNGAKKNEVSKASKQKPQKKQKPKTYATNYGRRGQHSPVANPGVNSKKVRQAPKGGRPKFFYGVLDFAVDLATGDVYETDLDEDYMNSHSRAEEVAKEYYRFLKAVQSAVGRTYFVPKSANGDKVMSQRVR